MLYFFYRIAFQKAWTCKQIEFTKNFKYKIYERFEIFNASLLLNFYVFFFFYNLILLQYTYTCIKNKIFN